MNVQGTTPSLRTAEAIDRAKAEGRSAFIGYLPACYPDLATSVEAAVQLAQNGADIIEIGAPYSDPVMDGPVIQQATTEALAAIGVFAALGFLAAGAPVGEVAESGLGLAFIAFPTIISEAPASALLGVLFFGSLAIAGLTSLISIMEVVVSSVKDKTGWSRPVSVAVAGGSSAVISVVLIGGVSGLTILDVVDAFSNNIGIVGAALVAVFLVTWVFRRMDVLAEGLNAYGSFRVGPIWKALIGIVLPVVLAYLLILDVADKLRNGYEGYDAWVLGTFGWGALALMLVLAVGLSLVRWSGRSSMHLENPETDEETV